MIVTCVNVWVKKEHIEDFIKQSTKNHNGAVNEAGNLRFDLLQLADDPTQFMIYEAYESDEAAAAHKETPHYKEWKDTVAAWMDKPRQGIKYNIVCPADKKSW